MYPPSIASSGLSGFSITLAKYCSSFFIRRPAALTGSCTPTIELLTHQISVVKFREFFKYFEVKYFIVRLYSHYTDYYSRPDSHNKKSKDFEFFNIKFRKVKALDIT